MVRAEAVQEMLLPELREVLGELFLAQPMVQAETALKQPVQTSQQIQEMVVREEVLVLWLTMKALLVGTAVQVELLLDIRSKNGSFC
jgi:hypothetical protein